MQRVLSPEIEPAIESAIAIAIVVPVLRVPSMKLLMCRSGI